MQKRILYAIFEKDTDRKQVYDRCNRDSYAEERKSIDRAASVGLASDEAPQEEAAMIYLINYIHERSMKYSFQS
jgi:hypothetical protein